MGDPWHVVGVLAAVIAAASAVISVMGVRQSRRDNRAEEKGGLERRVIDLEEYRRGHDRQVELNLADFRKVERSNAEHTIQIGHLLDGLKELKEMFRIFVDHESRHGGR